MAAPFGLKEPFVEAKEAKKNMSVNACAVNE